MSRLILVCTFLFGMMLPSSGVVTAQETATDVDVAAIGESVLQVDPNSLLIGLETPPDDANLPEGFINPPSGIPQNADLVEEFAGGFGDVEGAIGSIIQGFDTDPAIVPGLISSGILTYFVTEETIGPEALDRFEEGVSQGLDSAEATPVGGTPAAGGPASEVNVQRIDIGGTEAVVLTVGVELGAVAAVVQVVAVPVGNTLVVGTVVVVDQGEVDQEQVLSLAEALTLAGVEHIGTVAESAQ